MPSSVCSSTVVTAPARSAASSESALARRDQCAQDLPAVEPDLDPYEIVSHS